MSGQTLFELAVDEMLQLPDNDENTKEIFKFIDAQAFKKKISFYDAVFEYFYKKPKGNLLNN